MTPVDGVHLRPATDNDLWLFERQAVDPEAGGQFNWSGFRNVPATIRRFEENRLISDDGGCLIVEAENVATGTVVWSRSTYGIPSWNCWKIGISLLPEHRQKGYGTKAQGMLVAYLYETSNVQRIEAYTDVDNLPEQKCLEKVGFIKEGTLRATQFRKGEWRDLYLYSILRDEHKAHPTV